MKGDFSRLRFNPKKNYTSVLEQQGRVSLDSDANEQSLIDDYLRSTELSDVVGPYGGPHGNCGFAIAFTGGTLTIGKGRYYVDGLLCENDTDALHYEDQPFLIAPTVPTADLYSGLRSGKYVAVHVFLQVWQRLVTVLDDGCLREPALGQADTTARLQTVWRVIAEPVQDYEFQATDLTAKLAPEIEADVVKDLKIEDTATLDTALATDLHTNLAADLPTLKPDTVGCCDAMYDAATATATPGTMFAQTTAETDDCTCEPTPAAGYRGLENQLYRVEIHTGGTAAEATFKWSRENGSVVVAVVSASATVVTVASLGLDSNLGFNKGDWVEISDDADLFGSTPNQSGQLYQIDSIDRGALTVTLTASVATVGKNARMRRWDQGGTSAMGLPLNAGSFTTLENGIEVQFKDGAFVSGDYWLIPARTATGNIEWPPCGSTGDYQPPISLNVMLAPLACIAPPVLKADRGGVDERTIGDIEVYPVTDCRRCFYPLTDLTPPAVPKAIHVVECNWSNDDIITADVLVTNGIRVRLDQKPVSPITGANMIVTFEIAAPGAFEAASSDSYTHIDPTIDITYTVLRSVVVVDMPGAVDTLTVAATAKAAGYTELAWRLPFFSASSEYSAVVQEYVQGQDVLLLYIAVLFNLGAPLSRFCRVRVKLLGRTIFAAGSAGAAPIYLDGQCFGEPATRSDGSAGVGLTLPSGNDEKASDFESWFYVAPALFVTQVTTSRSEVTVTVDTLGRVNGLLLNKLTDITSTVTVSYPATKATTIYLTLSPAGIDDAIQIPKTVSLGQGKTTVNFPILVRVNPGYKGENAIGLTYTIYAEVHYAGDIPSVPASCQFTVYGGR